MNEAVQVETGQVRPEIVIVDDERAVTELFRDVGETQGWQVHGVNSPEQALRDLASMSPDMVFLDLVMPKMDGLTLASDLRERRGEIPIVFISGHATADSAIEALRLGAADFLRKPFEISRIVHTVQNVLTRERCLSSLRRGPQDMCSAVTASVLDAMMSEISVAGRFLSLLKEEIPGRLNPRQDLYVGLSQKQISTVQMSIEGLQDLSTLSAFGPEDAGELIDLSQVLVGAVKTNREATGCPELERVYVEENLPSVRGHEGLIAWTFHAMMKETRRAAGPMGLTLLFARKNEGTVEIRFSARRQGLRAPERQTSEAQVNQAICALITHLHHGRFSATDSCEEVVFTMRIPSAETYREGARGPGLNFDQEDIAPLDPEAIRKEENDLKGRKVNSHD